MNLQVRILSVLELADRAIVTFARQNYNYNRDEILGTATVSTQVFLLKRSASGGRIEGHDSMNCSRAANFFELPKAVAQFEVDHAGHVEGDIETAIEDYLVANSGLR